MPPLFHFRLQKVLEVREDKEKKAYQALASCQREMHLAHEKLKGMMKESDDMKRFSIENRCSCTDVQQFKEWENYMGCLSREIKGQEKAIAEIEKRVEKERQKTEKAMQERKALENIKVKQHKDFIIDLDKNEQKLNDEMALYSYFRNNSL